MAGFAVLGRWFSRRKVGYGYSGGGEGVFRPFCPGVGRRRAGERRRVVVGLTLLADRVQLLATQGAPWSGLGLGLDFIVEKGRNL
eukprot:scaffold8217_cov75-Attheya_sp.AAC.2